MSERVTFTGHSGATLSGRLEMPQGPPRAMAIFAHCFTCSKDVAAASRVSRALSREGCGVLRFDFTGLGNSEGDFESTNFSSNIDDLVAASEWLEKHHGAPSLLVGHSLGGAAVLRAALRLPKVRAVATIGAPASPDHVTHLFSESVPEILEHGEREVTLGGRAFSIQRQFLEDLAEHGEARPLSDLEAAVLIFHSPDDEIVSVEEAANIYRRVPHPKSFVSLPGADHLLSKKEDSEYVATVLASWVDRYLPDSPEKRTPLTEEGEVIATGNTSGFRTQVAAGDHLFIADEPASMGGTNHGPTPYDLLLAALGACTSMTLNLYAKRKKWPLEKVTVTLRHERKHEKDCEGADKFLDHLERDIQVEGALDGDQKQRLLEIAERCPVHRTLENHPKIVTTLTSDS